MEPNKAFNPFTICCASFEEEPETTKAEEPAFTRAFAALFTELPANSPFCGTGI